MNNKDTFGCTTFRKGNYLGRSYDFYCNNVASSVLHTGRIEGVRYESIGMSGSSFNGMIKEKALDGSIDKATMDTLFSSIVDGINENGVAISTLVVPRGDKGITTGTNPSKPSITARLVSRVVMDKAYSAKHAIKLLSDLNIKQNWGTEYELHWMIADKNSTYIVETVDNKLSYLGPEAIEGIEDLYNGQLEADVITNFYQTGFKSVESSNGGLLPDDYVEITLSDEYEGNTYTYVLRAYDCGTREGLVSKGYYWHDYDDIGVFAYITQGELPTENDGGTNSIELMPGYQIENPFTGGSVSDARIDENHRYLIVVDANKTSPLVLEGLGYPTEPGLYLEYWKTPIDENTRIAVLMSDEETYEWLSISKSYNTFEMPITNPTVTPHGCGLERYKVVRDKLEQVNGNLADDKEAMEIINLVQYTNAYKMDNTWYSEFVDHEHDNRSPLREGSILTYVCEYEDYDGYGVGDTYCIYKINVTDPSIVFDSTHAVFLDSECEGTSAIVADKDRYIYWEVGEDVISKLEDGCYYLDIASEDKELFETAEFLYNGYGDWVLPNKHPSEYVDKVNELRTTYNQILSEGGKEAVRKIGLAWHSNHQCIYDIVNKTMLVYPSENGEHAFRVDIHGVVEDEAVEIEEDLDGPLVLYGVDEDNIHYYFVHKDYIVDGKEIYLVGNLRERSIGCVGCVGYVNGKCTYMDGFLEKASKYDDYEAICHAEELILDVERYETL